MNNVKLLIQNIEWKADRFDIDELPESITFSEPAIKRFENRFGEINEDELLKNLTAKYSYIDNRGNFHEAKALEIRYFSILIDTKEDWSITFPYNWLYTKYMGRSDKTEFKDFTDYVKNISTIEITKLQEEYDDYYIEINEDIDRE